MADLVIVGPNDLYFRDINIITSYSCGPTDTAEALKITAEARDSLKSIIIFD